MMGRGNQQRMRVHVLIQLILDCNIGRGYPMYVKQHNDILKEMKAKSSLFLNEQDKNRGSRSDRERLGDRCATGDHGKQ